MKTLLKYLLSFCIAGCAGCATRPNYNYRSDYGTPLQANYCIPQIEGEPDFDYRLAGMQFISTIEDSTITNGFHEMDEAAVAILNILIPLSKTTDVEYGGYIYKKEDRFYFTNPPVKGSGITVDVELAQRLIPEDAEITGDYHTHFRERPEEIRSENNFVRDYDFSRVDIEGIKKDSEKNSDYKGYLGTPQGSIQVFVPHSYEKFYTASTN